MQPRIPGTTPDARIWISCEVDGGSVGANAPNVTFNLTPITEENLVSLCVR